MKKFKSTQKLVMNKYAHISPRKSKPQESDQYQAPLNCTAPFTKQPPHHHPLTAK